MVVHEGARLTTVDHNIENIKMLRHQPPVAQIISVCIMTIPSVGLVRLYINLTLLFCLFLNWVAVLRSLNWLNFNASAWQHYDRFHV